MLETPEHVRRLLARQIAAGELRPGQRLGAEREMAAEFGVSRATLRQALATLEEAGMIRRVPGRGGGTFVTREKIERDLSTIQGIPALLRSQGVTAGTHVLSARLAEPDDAAGQALRMRPGELVVDLLRIRLADGSPFSLEHARLPARRFPGLLELPLGGSVYELLAEHYGAGPTRPSSGSRWRSRRRSRRRCSTCPRKRRCWRSRASVPIVAVTRSSSRATCSGATGHASWSGRAAGPPDRAAAGRRWWSGTRRLSRRDQ